MDLLSCPFCGQKPPYVELVKVFIHNDGQPDSWAENKKNRWQVACGQCAAHSAVCRSEGEAVAHWNTRSDTDRRALQEHLALRSDRLHPSWQTASREILLEQVSWGGAVIRSLTERLDALAARPALTLPRLAAALHEALEAGEWGDLDPYWIKAIVEGFEAGDDSAYEAAETRKLLELVVAKLNGET